MARLSRSLTTALRRRGLMVAAITAGGIFVMAFVQVVLLSLVALGGGAALGAGGLDTVTIFAASFADTAGRTVPLLIGVFLSLWQVAPISEALRPGHVVTRALLAIGFGALAAGLSELIAGLIVGGGDLAIPEGLILALINGLSVAIQTAPIVLLGAFLSWGWQQRHPLRYELRGALDEV